MRLIRKNFAKSDYRGLSEEEARKLKTYRDNYAKKLKDSYRKTQSAVNEFDQIKIDEAKLKRFENKIKSNPNLKDAFKEAESKFKEKKSNLPKIVSDEFPEHFADNKTRVFVPTGKGSVKDIKSNLTDQYLTQSEKVKSSFRKKILNSRKNTPTPSPAVDNIIKRTWKSGKLGKVAISTGAIGTLTGTGYVLDKSLKNKD